MCIHYLLAMLSGMYFGMCISSRIATIMVLEHTNICIYYPTASRIYLQIQAVLVTANRTTWKKALCWNLDSKLLARNFTIL